MLLTRHFGQRKRAGAAGQGASAAPPIAKALKLGRESIRGTAQSDQQVKASRLVERRRFGLSNKILTFSRRLSRFGHTAPNRTQTGSSRSRSRSTAFRSSACQMWTQNLIHQGGTPMSYRLAVQFPDKGSHNYNQTGLRRLQRSPIGHVVPPTASVNQERSQSRLTYRRPIHGKRTPTFGGDDLAATA